MNTRQISDEVWNKIRQTVEVAKTKVGSKDTGSFLHIPLCIGFTTSISKDEFEAMNAAIVSEYGQGYSFVLYLNPNDSVATGKWLDENEALIASLKKSKHLFTADEWRVEETVAAARVKAREAFDGYYMDNALAVTMQTLLVRDADKFLRGVKKRTDDDTNKAKEYIQQELIDVLACATKCSLNKTPLSEVNILFYNDKLYSSIQNAMQHLHHMGYEKESLHHVIARLVPVAKNEKLTPPLPMQSQHTGTRKSPAKSPVIASTPPSPPRQAMPTDEGVDPVVLAMTKQAIAEGPEYAGKFMAVYKEEQKQAAELKKRLAVLQAEQARDVNLTPRTPASTPVTVPKPSPSTWPAKNSPQSPSPEPSDSPPGTSPSAQPNELLSKPKQSSGGGHGFFANSSNPGHLSKPKTNALSSSNDKETAKVVSLRYSI